MSQDSWTQILTQSGERWDQIAFRFYGDASAYHLILQANATLEEIYKEGRLRTSLPGGIRLNIPPYHTKARTLAGLPPWRASLQTS